ncbi:MAG: xanthine dehydrogenase family protein molybdopterin-binding subunit [Actinobacteria bacterium]|nr:xanthine dehydrogenase family protein molybdopterin-binding subunit [Actinomycetota bacterium]
MSPGSGTADVNQQARPARYTGERIKRLEDPRLLMGRARFIDDLGVPGMVHAAFVRSPHPHARIVSIDNRAALALDGVVAVVTGADLAAETAEMEVGAMLNGVEATSRPAIAISKVRHVGDPVAVVVARSPYLAEDGRDLVRVEWEPLPPVPDVGTALADGAPLIDEALETNHVAHGKIEIGDPDGQFETAAHVCRKTFKVGRSTGAPVETRGLLAECDAGSGAITLWTSTQMPHLTRTLLAPMLRVPENKLSVHSPEVGGGFGLKCHIFPEDVAVPAVARRIGRPVKWIEDRWENLSGGVHSKEMDCEVEVALDADGKMLAIRGAFVTDGGAYSSIPYTPLIDSGCAAGMLPSMYDVGHVAAQFDAAYTNKASVGAIRGVGWASGQLARETLLDDAARQVGIDPVELRLRNMLSSEPQKNIMGLSLDGGSYAESLAMARDAIGYEEFRRRQDELRAGGRYLGIGFSPFIEPTGMATASARAAGFDIAYFDSATVTVDPDGTATVSTGLHSHGQGHETTLAQVAADALGFAIEDIRVVFGSSDSQSYGMGTYASRSAVVGSGTIMAAAAQVRARLLELAATLLEADARDIDLAHGVAHVKGAPARGVTVAELAGFGYFGYDARPDDVQESGLTATAAYDPPETYANGTTAAVVEVDPALGTVDLQRLVAVEDCGRMLNPFIVDGQVAGAVAQGVGIALLEDLAYGEDGEFLAGSLMHYLYPSTTELPRYDLLHIETPSSASTGGVKGVGEAGTIAAPAAVVNAISDAISPFGVSIDRVPVTPVYLRDLLRGAGR